MWFCGLWNLFLGPKRKETVCNIVHGSDGDERHLISSLGLWALGVSGASSLWDSAEEVAGPLSSEQDHILLTP